ncbi:hypothetical protein [Lactococcus lactis]|uniref:hypothetical protein n=1 Tax=Lactococcus lactis TaxID=1358 RepID=UPI00111F3330|nr:hypothetical protein [Lactococcus lactis]MCI1071878.1 hypothetical protein [Lactococcus lactis]TNU79012.1 hypothetical protein FIB48_08300 [Lactococcus lactis subsp. lactis]
MVNIDNDGELIWSVDDLHDFLKRAKESGKKKESLLHDKLFILQSNYDELVKNMKKFPIDILDFGYDIHIKDNLSLLKEILEKGRIIYEKSSDIVELCHEIDLRFIKTHKKFPTKAQYNWYLNLKSSDIERIKNLDEN